MNVLVIREILLVEALTTVLILAEVCYKSRNINTVTENNVSEAPITIIAFQMKKRE